jgi:hypothetical protein
MERFSRTAQFFSRALAQLHVKAGVYIYALENAGGHRVDLFEGDRAWSSGVTHARFSCLKKRQFFETIRFSLARLLRHFPEALVGFRGDGERAQATSASIKEQSKAFPRLRTL